MAFGRWGRKPQRERRGKLTEGWCLQSFRCTTAWTPSFMEVPWFKMLDINNLFLWKTEKVAEFHSRVEIVLDTGKSPRLKWPWDSKTCPRYPQESTHIVWEGWELCGIGVVWCPFYLDLGARWPPGDIWVKLTSIKHGTSYWTPLICQTLCLGSYPGQMKVVSMGRKGAWVTAEKLPLRGSLGWGWAGDRWTGTGGVSREGKLA